MKAIIDSNNIIREKLIKSVGDITYFEYDEEVSEYCVFFNWLDWFYWQWKTKELALLELISWYLDTYNL